MMNEIKACVLSIVGAVGGGLAAWFGGWDLGLLVLVGCMAVDYLSGLAIALVWKKSPKSASGAASSEAGFKGLLKKAFILAIVLVSHMLDLVMGTAFVRDAVIIAYIANEVISITENAGIMGVPLPPPLAKAIDLLAKKSEGVKHGD